jgi:hypothetical protein
MDAAPIRLQKTSEFNPRPLAPVSFPMLCRAMSWSIASSRYSPLIRFAAPGAQSFSIFKSRAALPDAARDSGSGNGLLFVIGSTELVRKKVTTVLPS